MSNSLGAALEAAKKDYKHLVRDIADGIEVDLDKAKDLSISVGRGLVGLQEDVEAAKPILAAEKYIARSSKVETAIKKLINKQHDITHKLTAAREELAAETARLQQNVKDLEREFHLASSKVSKAKEDHRVALNEATRLVESQEG